MEFYQGNEHTSKKTDLDKIWRNDEKSPKVRRPRVSLMQLATWPLVLKSLIVFQAYAKHWKLGRENMIIPAVKCVTSLGKEGKLMKIPHKRV